MQHDKAKTPISFVVPTDVLTAIDAEARGEGLSRSDVIRRLILRHVQAQASTPAPTQSTTTPPRAA